MKWFIQLLMLISLILGINACNNSNNVDRKFDKGLWKIRDPHYLYRKSMINDLMKHHLSDSITYGEIVNLLGSGDFAPHCDSAQIIYEIDVDYFGIDPVSGLNLIISFTADSVLSDMRLDKWNRKFR